MQRVHWEVQIVTAVSTATVRYNPLTVAFLFIRYLAGWILAHLIEGGGLRVNGLISLSYKRLFGFFLFLMYKF